MKLTFLLTVLLFCSLFIFSVPIRAKRDEFADLLNKEISLEDSVSKISYELSLLQKSIDSLSSRNRIDSIAALLELGKNNITTKITDKK